MFSFFRKPKPDEVAPKKPVAVKPAPPPEPKAAPAPAAAPVTITPQAQPGRNEEIVVFESISAEACSVVEEAAVYYANNLAAQAVAALSQYLQDHPDKKEIQPWLMLFDLYQLVNNKQAFNELSLQFVVKFERSAPVWKNPEAPAPAKKVDPVHRDFIALGDKLAAGPQLDKICLLAQGANNARVELGDIKTVDLEGCRVMQEGLQSCRKKGRVIQLEGVERLIEVLKQQIAADGHGDADRLAWLLLFEIYQWLGKEAEYEDLAIEYAVTFEISPPAWEAVKPALTAAQAKPKTPQLSAVEPADEDAFALRGVISESSQGQLQELANFAADKQEVRINLSQVTRVDFVAVGNFMGTLISLTQAGKKVLLLEANEMIQALFNVMGVSEFATLMRKKPR